MTPSFELQPRGRHGWAGPAVRAEPAAGDLIKEEPTTVVWRQTLPDGTSAVWKLYRHRRRSPLERFGLYTGRAEREFRALCHLDDHGVACSAPLFWARGVSPDTARYELLATREVAGASDLRTWMARHPGEEPPDLVRLFSLASAMHRTGLQHGALWGRNVLLAGRDYCLIDLPRSHIFGGSIEGRGPGLFDVRALLQNLAIFLPDGALVPALAGYPGLPAPAADLVRAMRPQPLSPRRLNAWHALYTARSACSRLARPRRKTNDRF